MNSGKVPTALNTLCALALHRGGGRPGHTCAGVTARFTLRAFPMMLFGLESEQCHPQAHGRSLSYTGFSLGTLPADSTSVIL